MNNKRKRLSNDDDKSTKICKTFIDNISTDLNDSSHMIKISAGFRWYTIKVGDYLCMNNILYNYSFELSDKCTDDLSAYSMYKKAYEKMINACPDAILIKTHKNIKRSEM